MDFNFSNNTLTLHVTKEGMDAYHEAKLNQLLEEVLPPFQKDAEFYGDAHAIEQLRWAASTQLRTRQYDLDALSSMLDKIMEKRMESMRPVLTLLARRKNQLDKVEMYSDKQRPITLQDLKDILPKP